MRAQSSTLNAQPKLKQPAMTNIGTEAPEVTAEVTAEIIDVLKLKNPHERDSRITFDPVPHTYTIDGDTHPDHKYTSVTTWNHAHFEVFNADAVITKMMESKTWATNPKYKGQTRDQIKEGWDSNRDQAAAAGTEMHAAIELFYNRSPGTLGANPETPEFGYFLNFARTFHDKNKTLRAYRTEWTVFHEEARISGSIDMVFENLDPETGAPNGTYSIYDWKRCKEIVRHSAFNKWATTPGLEHLPDTNYWHYCLQLNVYKYILQEKYGKTVTDLYLVCLHPDNSNRDYQRIKVADLQSEVADIMRARIESFAQVAAVAAE
jgi:hypothetical protein